MSTTAILLLIVPFLALVIVFGTVVIVALCQAKPEDVPSVLKECTDVFRRLAEHTASTRTLNELTRDTAAAEQHTHEESATEEIA